jgi:hypothetical protein
VAVEGGLAGYITLKQLVQDLQDAQAPADGPELTMQLLRKLQEFMRRYRTPDMQLCYMDELAEQLTAMCHTVQCSDDDECAHLEFKARYVT